MKINRIGFGYTKNLGGYENCKVWLEADLEDWEDPSESLNQLRDRVVQELDLPDKWFDLKGKFARQLTAVETASADLEEVKQKLERAKKRWAKYAAFLVAHGVDPELLIITERAGTVSPAEAAEIASALDAANDLLPLNTDCGDYDPYHGPDDGNYFDDPHYSDEYYRLHDRADSEDDDDY